MNTNFGHGFWCGVIVTFIFVNILISLPFSDISLYKKAKEECEKSLPRDQHCVIIGVPKVEK